MGGETEGLILFIFLVWSALIVCGWVVVYSRKCYLGPTVSLFLIQARKCKVSVEQLLF